MHYGETGEKVRKHQQRQIFSMLETIKAAQAAGLYADCQNGCLALGEYIESIEGEGTQTVAALETYAELLFKAHQAEIGESILNIHLDKIDAIVKEELGPKRIEVAFLAYKASMSDSIESIYFAAKADPDCDAYWIPVPYFDRNSDGTFGEMHFEGADFYGEEFDCTDWREYDIEARHPDIIFTYNPYDAENYLTSVHPSFYCQRLRDLTECLIYVPYYVVTDNVTESLCALAGCVFAHKVIVQSEKVRNTYIRTLRRHYGNKLGRLEDKIIALGSPKFDKVINTKREDCSIPKEWQALIGTRKVLLYNTNISAILAGDEQYLKKLRAALNLFSSFPEVALWWRPHPLNEVTYRAMRPELLNEYMQIVAQFRREGWGIYDDTPDVHRAIACSDAYYGDDSSLVAMCLAIGKPVLISDIEILDDRITAYMAGVLVSGNNIWFTQRHFNALFRMDKDNWCPECLGMFPGESAYTETFHATLYQESCKNSDSIYFSPFFSNEIACYSIVEKVFKKIPLKQQANAAIKENLLGAVAYGDAVYFTPFGYPAIVRLDVKTEELTYYSDWVAQLQGLEGYQADAFFLFPLVHGSSIYLAACGANAVVQFNMETQKSTVHVVGKAGYRYGGICFDGNNIWLSPRQYTYTPIVKWNPDTGETEELVLPAEKEKNNYFLSIVYCKGYVWLLPHFANNAYKIDIYTNEMSIAEEFAMVLENNETLPHMKYWFAQVFGDSIYTYNEHKNTLVCYNCETLERREECIRYSQEASTALMEMPSSVFALNPKTMKTIYDCIYYEKGARLANYILYVAEDNNGKKHLLEERRKDIMRANNKHVNGAAGLAIYKKCKTFVLQDGIK